MALTARDSDGDQYRLRNAVFQVTGYAYDPSLTQPPAADDDAGVAGNGGTGSNPVVSSVTVSTEDNPDAEFINLTLTPGYYTVELINDSWFLERATETGAWERVDGAELISPKLQAATVVRDQTTSINYRFSVEGEIIDMGTGDLTIGITVEKRQPSTAGSGAAGSGAEAGAAGSGEEAGTGAAGSGEEAGAGAAGSGGEAGLEPIPGLGAAGSAANP